MKHLTTQQKRWLFRIAKLLIFVAVVVGIARFVSQALEEVESEGFDIWGVDAGWFCVAAAAYLVGMIPAWLYWHQALRSMGQRPTLRTTFRAYFMSHLGKYVPGKAMVVIMRVGAVRRDGVDMTVAATSVFIETLTLMAVGALVAAGIIGALFREQTMLVWTALGMMLLSGVPTLPPIFRRVVMFLPIKRANPNIEENLRGLNFRLIGLGWSVMPVVWFVFGFSLWATLSAMPDANPSLSQLPLFTACVALATVAGFVSMIPGGVGVRELVMIPLLAEVGGFGKLYAVVSAFLLRLAWLLSEVMVLIILYLWARIFPGRPVPTADEMSS